MSFQILLKTCKMNVKKKKDEVIGTTIIEYA